MYIYRSQELLVLFACLSVMAMEVNTSTLSIFGYPGKVDLKDDY